VLVNSGKLVTVEVDLDAGTMYYRVESGSPCLICRGVSGPVRPAFFNDGEIRLDTVRASPASEDLLVWDLDVQGENANIRGKVFESSCAFDNSGCWGRLRTRFDSGQFSFTFTIRTTEDQLCFGLARSGTIPKTADWKADEFCMLRADNGATSVFGTVTKLSEEQQKAYTIKPKLDDRVTCDVDLAAGTMHYAINGAERRLAFSGVSGSVHIAMFNDGILRLDAVKVGLTNPPQKGSETAAAACYATLPFPRVTTHPAHVGCDMEYIDALDDHSCDVCAKPLEDGSREYRCANHDFDLCSNCWTRQSREISLAHPVPAAAAAPATIAPPGVGDPDAGMVQITVVNPLQARHHRSGLDRK
jgi:hypothetical protein